MNSKTSYTAEEFQQLIKQGVFGVNKKGKMVENELIPEYKAMLEKEQKMSVKKKESKYLNVRKEYNGRVYHSKKEAKYAEKLDNEVKNGIILSYTPQVRIKIEINGFKICTYICDFVIENLSGELEYVDVKGSKYGAPYQMFSLKKKLVKAIHGIDIIEV